MNTLQLESVLAKDAHVGPMLQGVYALDRVPRLKPGCYVVNTAPASHPGRHWIALFVTDREIEYFDSYGLDPLPRLKQKGKTKSWRHNPMPLQSPLTSVCGQYCVYYLLHRARDVSLKSILKHFDSDVDMNDQLVYDFVRDRYAFDQLKLIDTKKVISQLSRPRFRTARTDVAASRHSP